MFPVRGRGRGRGRGPMNSARKVPLKGRFMNGVWHCNCGTPAEYFQTKNGGKNHGRWFYTCQKPQHTRCDFFLWKDEAQPREAKALLANSRSEPQTPAKSPGTRHRSNSLGDRSRTATPDPGAPQTPSKGSAISAQKSWSVTADPGKDSFEWSSSDEAEFSKAADRVATTTMPPPPETPRKATRTDLFSSPGKRTHEEMENAAGAWPTPATDGFFTTPVKGMRGKDLFSTASAAGLMSPADTPTPIRFKDTNRGGSADDPELVKEVVDALRDEGVILESTAMEALKSVLNKHAIKAQGIAKGRDISRLAIKLKDAKIGELQGRIATLEAERETHRAVIRHLRRDMEVGRRR